MSEHDEILELLENFAQHIVFFLSYRASRVNVVREGESSYRLLVWGRELARISFDAGYPVRIEVAEPYRHLVTSQSPQNKRDLISALAQLEVGAGRAGRMRTSFVIEELRLRHFRAFENARLPLDGLTAVVGVNGSGKSSLLDAVELMRHALSDSLQSAVERFGGLDAIRQRRTDDRAPHDVSLALVVHLPSPTVPEKELRLVYGFTLAGSPDGDLEVTQEILNASDPAVAQFRRSVQHGVVSTIPELAPVIAPDSLLFPSIAGRDKLWKAILQELGQARVYRFNPDAIRQVQRPGRTSHLLLDGRNAGDVLRQIQGDEHRLRWVLDHLAAITPDIVGLGTRSDFRLRVVCFDQKVGPSSTQSFDALSMSDGTLHALGVLLALAQKPEPSLVMFDEIEDSIHPSALAILIDALAASSEKFSVVFTSHSPEALTHPEITGERTRVVRWRNGVSHVYPLRSSVLKSLRPSDSVGELFRDNALFTADEPLTNVGDFYGATA